jgi:cytochrome c oxidase assembly protein subunit 19
MAPDSFKNLGFGDDADAAIPALNATTVTPSQPRPEVPTHDKSRPS